MNCNQHESLVKGVSSVDSWRLGSMAGYSRWGIDHIIGGTEVWEGMGFIAADWQLRFQLVFIDVQFIEFIAFRGSQKEYKREIKVFCV